MPRKRLISHASSMMAQADFWSMVAPGYEEVIFSWCCNAHVPNMMTSSPPLANDAKILDIGCGTGILVPAIVSLHPFTVLHHI